MYKLVVVTEEGQTVIIPSALQAILDAFNQLNQTIQPVLELSDAVVKDVSVTTIDVCTLIVVVHCVIVLWCLCFSWRLSTRKRKS